MFDNGLEAIRNASIPFYEKNRLEELYLNEEFPDPNFSASHNEFRKWLLDNCIFLNHAQSVWYEFIELIEDDLKYQGPNSIYYDYVPPIKNPSVEVEDFGYVWG